MKFQFLNRSSSLRNFDFLSLFVRVMVGDVT